MRKTIDITLQAEIFSGLGQMVWTKDIRTGELVFLTDNFTQVFEVPMEELRSNPSLLQSLTHPDDAPYLEIFSKVLLSNGLEDQVYRIITPTGKLKWISERKRTYKNEVGEIYRLDVLLTEITRQKLEEQRLLESEVTFKSFFFQNPLPMWVYDVETLQFLLVNDAAVKFYGYTLDEFSRMTIKQIRPKEDVPRLLEVIKTADHHPQKEHRWVHVRKDGKQVTVHISSSAITFKEKRARLVSATDVSQTAENEKLGLATNRYLERFKASVSQAISYAVFDGSGYLVHVNQTLEARIEIPEANLIGRHFYDLFASIHKRSVLDEVWQNCSRGEIWQGERKLNRKAGPDFWANCTVVPLKDERNRIDQYLFIADDITSLKEAERKNREYAVRLHDILEGVTDAIFVLNRRWLVMNVNRQAEDLLGQRRNQLLGQNIWEIFPHEEGFRFYQFFRKAKKRKMTVQFEEYYAPLDQWFDISLYPSKEGLAVCFRNVTERRKKEGERRELMDHLISQNRDLEEFTYIASHSLRAHIANIAMLSSAIDTAGMSARNHEIFEKLFQSSNNLESVMKDLNTILTVKDRSQIRYEEFSVEDSFKNAVSRLSYDLLSFRKFIRADIEPQLRFCTVRSYVETILTQFLSNALRFRSIDKDPDIRVAITHQEEMLFISVSDNGKGIDLPKNFKQLFHLYKTFHPGTSGKGLGLYLAKILIEELKGTIDFKSRPGTGTTVTLQIPRQG